MTLHEAENVQSGPLNNLEPEMKPATKTENDTSQLRTSTAKHQRKLKLRQLFIAFSQLKNKFTSSCVLSWKPVLYKLIIAFVVSFICLTVYLSGSGLCEQEQSRKTSCLALGLCSNRNDPHGSIANKIKSNVICPFHKVVDHIVSTTSAAITGSEDPFGTDSMVPVIDPSVLIL